MSNENRTRQRSVRFRPRQAFTRVLNTRVEQYFLDNHIPEVRCPLTVHQIIPVMVVSLILSWAVLVLVPVPLWASALSILVISAFCCRYGICRHARWWSSRILKEAMDQQNDGVQL